jgi:hypothetical protein
LVDSGNISTSATGVKTYTPGTPLYLARGRYLTAFNNDTGSVNWRFFVGGSVGMDPVLGAGPYLAALRVTRAYAAFPSPGTAWDTVIGETLGMRQYVVLRITAP